MQNKVIVVFEFSHSCYTTLSNYFKLERERDLNDHLNEVSAPDVLHGWCKIADSGWMLTLQVWFTFK